MAIKYVGSGNAEFDAFTVEYAKKLEDGDKSALKFRELAAADDARTKADNALLRLQGLQAVQSENNAVKKKVATYAPSESGREQARQAEIYREYGDIDAAVANAQLEADMARRQADYLGTTSRAKYADDFDAKSVFDSQNYDTYYNWANRTSEDNYMTDEERGVYNYIYATEGAEAARAFLDSLTDYLNQREGQTKADKVEGKFLGQMGVKAAAGFDQFGSGIASLLNDGQVKAPSAIQYASAAVDEDLAGVDLKWYDFAEGQWKDQKIFGRSLGQVAGDAVQTTANMAPSILASLAVGTVSKSAGTWVGSILMGSSAAGNAYQDMLNQGYSQDSAVSYGVLCGLSEVLLEKALGGITALGGGNLSKAATGKLAKLDGVLKKFAQSSGGKVLLNAGSEAIEEGLQSILEPYFKTIVTGEEFTVEMEEALYSALMGFVTGGVFEGVPAATKAAGSKIASGIEAKKNAKAEASTDTPQQAEPAAGAGVQSEVGKDVLSTQMPSTELSEGLQNVDTEVDSPKLAWDKAVQKYVQEGQTAPAASTRESQVAQSDTAKAEDSPLKAASKRYGAQATMMEDAYQEGQDVERYDREYKLAYDLGKEGASRELLDDGETLIYLTAEQRDTAYRSGAAAAENAGIVAAAVKSLGITGEHAGVLERSFNANQITAKDYAMGLQEAYEAGKTGIPMKEAGSHAAKLTDAQRQIAYKQGQKASGRQVAKQQAQVRKNRSAEGADTSKGKVHFDGDRSSLNKTQLASLDAMEVLAKALGVQIHVFESEVDENGNHVGANGWYDPSDGSIHIDLYAGNSGKGTMLFTVAHELTHFIKQWSPAKFEVLANFLTKQYTAQGQSISELVEAQQDKAARNGRELDYDAAYEEMVADSMESMLSDGSIIEMMAELRQQDQSLWAKIRDWFKDLAGKLRAVVDAYKGVQPDSAEGRMVAGMKDMIGTLEALYMDALVDASENFDAGVQKNTTEDSGGVKYSLMAFDKDGRRFVEIDQDQDRFDGHNADEYPKIAKTIINEKFNGHVIGVDNKMFVNGSGRDEFANPSKHLDSNLYETKMRTAGELDNLLDAGANFRNEPDGADGHIHPDVIGGFDYFDTLFKIGNKYFSAVINIKNVKRGKLFKDVTKIKDVTQDIMSSYGNNPKSQFLRTSSKDSIRNPGELVNKKFSDRDSTGNQLSAEQQEYFKGSKERDNQGRLRVMYRGDSTEVTVFDRKKSSYSNLYGRGFYFTNSASHAGQYGQATAYYLNITNPVSTTDCTITKEQMRKFLEAVAENEDDYSFENYGYGATIESVLEGLYTGKSDFAMLYDVSQTAIGDMVEAVELFNKTNGTNYDGFILDTETVIFNSAQAKRTDNHNPTANPDTRYSQRDVGRQEAVTQALEALYMDALVDAGENYQASEQMGVVDDFVKEYKESHKGERYSSRETDAAGVDTSNKVTYHKENANGQEVNGNERREETREAFLRRASKTLHKVKERGSLAFGYRHYYSQLSPKIQAAKEGLTKLNIPVVVFEQMEGNKGGITTVFHNDALAIPGVAVFIHKDATVDAQEIVGHEGYHYLRGFVNRDAYIEALTANIDFASEAFTSYQQKYVEDIYFDEDVEIGSEEWALLMEEIFAYITGDIHNGDPRGEVHKFIRNYDAVKAAWDELIKHFGLARKTDSFSKYLKFSGRDSVKSNKLHSYAEIEEERQKLFQRERDLLARKREAESNAELLQAMDDYSALFDEARSLFAKRRQGTATQEELDRIEEIKALREERLNRVSELQESLGLSAMEKEVYDIRAESEALRIASDEAWAREGAERENKAIEKAGVPTAEYFRKKALKSFKTTTNFNEAGYLLPDGKLLNFSGGERNHRYRDHREIGEIYEATQGVAALNRFLGDGNIRIMAESPGIDLAAGVEPTKEQYAALRKFINTNGVNDGQFFVDFSNTDGSRAGNYSYQGRVFADRIINDIKYFYENGSVREQSSVASFLHSERDPDYQKVNQALENENTKLREDVAELRELVKLQRQVTNGTKFTKTSVEAAARYLKQSANAKGSTQELMKLLNGLYEYIASARELTWEDVKEQAQAAVDWLWEHIDRQGKRSDYAQDILKQLHGAKVRLDESQMAEAAYRFGSYDAFRKGLMGNITLAKNANTSLDSLWAEMAEMYPDVFDGEISAADMPSALIDVIHRLRSPDTTIDYARNREMMEQELLQEVYDSYWRVSTLYTPADVGARRINKLKSEHYQRMEKLKQDHREAVDRLKQAHQARLEQVRKDHRAKLEEKVEQVAKRYQDARKQNVEGRNKTEMRRRIRKKIRELSKLLVHGTKERNVKEGMKDFVSTAIASAEVLFIDEYTNEDMVRNGVACYCEAWESSLLDKTRALIRQRDDLLATYPTAKEMDEVVAGDLSGYEQRMKEVRRLERKISENMGKLRDVFVKERARMNEATVSSLLNSLAEEYWKLGTADEEYIRGALDENVHQHLLNLSEEIGGTTVKDMSLSQLEQLHRAYTMVLTTVRNANKSFAENLKGTRQEQSQAVVWDLAEAGKKRKKQTKGQIARAKRSWNNLKSVYAFERIGSGTLKRLYENLRGGEDTWMVDMDHAREHFLKAAKDTGYNGWDLNEQTHSFESSTGLEFSLNLGQIMSIYAYARRGEQALDHLMKGGFVFDKYTEERVTEHGIPKTYLKDDATAYNLSLETIQQIIGKLTPEQRAFVEKMQDYLSDTMGGKGNEVSMKLYGVKLFGEKFYFPLRSSEVYSSKAADQEIQKQQGQVSIKNAGFTHSTTPNAANPVVLSGFMDVWANHVNDMSMYHAFVLPMEDFNKVYHYGTPHTEESQSGAVKQAIINAHGSAATEYINQFVRDLNGGVVTDPREGQYKAWISKFKKASVMASASVVIQQPTAIVRALAYIDPKYFGAFSISRGIGRALGNKITGNHTQLYDELKKYAPVAAIKQMGRFDTDMGMGAVDYLTAKEFEGFKEQTKAIFKEKGYLGKRMDEVTGFLAERADEITWAQIWQAVKNEVADKQGLKMGSEAHLQAAGKRFTEVITRTQVYDSVFSRSANMRAKTGMMSMVTSFMAEPTTTANMLTDAIRKAKQGDVKHFLRVSASVAGAIIFNNILRSAVYAMRDDDEDETFVEKYLQALTGGVFDDVNPMSYLPFWRDVWSLVQRYDVERADMSVIATLMDAAYSLADVMAKDTSGMTEEELAAHEKKKAQKGWSFADALASAVGLPMKNVRRDILGAVNLVDTLKADGSRKTTSNSLRDKVWEDFVSSVPGAKYVADLDSRTDDLYDAIVAGDNAYMERLKSGYKSEQSYLQAVRKGLRENDGRIRAAAVARIDGDLDTYMTIAKEIIAEGNFTQDDVVVAINAVISELTPSGSSSVPKAKGLFDANAFATAISQDDAEMAKLIRADIIRTAQRNGKTEDEAAKSFVSSVTSACKEMFSEGDLSEEQAVSALMNFCDKDRVEARASVAYWDFTMEYPDVGASAGWFETYYKKVENSGVSIEEYVEYRNRKTGYTKRAEVLAIIDGMDLTRKQKDALYRAEGYAESTLEEAPWHK